MLWNLTEYPETSLAARVSMKAISNKGIKYLKMKDCSLRITFFYFGKFSFLGMPFKQIKRVIF